jgi:hypothetical protein
MILECLVYWYVASRIIAGLAFCTSPLKTNLVDMHINCNGVQTLSSEA